MQETAGTTASTLDIGRCFDEALAVWKANWLFLAIAAFLVVSVSTLSFCILSGPLAGGIAVMSLEALRRGDKTVVLSDLFRDFSLARLFDKFLPLMGLFFLSTAAIVVGLVACVVPGLILMTFWLYCYYLMVDRNLGVFASLRVSREIVAYKGFWVNLLLAVIGLAIELGAMGIPYLGAVVAWFVAPIGWLVQASAYIQLVDEDSGLLHDLIKAEQECARVGM